MSKLLKDIAWKLDNDLDMITSWDIQYDKEEFQNLINSGVVKVKVVFDGERNDDAWNGKFTVWKILDVVKN